MATKDSGAGAPEGSRPGDALGADDARRQLDPAGVTVPRPGSVGLAGDPSTDSPKPHGDKLGAASATAKAASDAATGDSPKPHGDKLEGPVGEATKG
jgi:hypothetical protein